MHHTKYSVVAFKFCPTAGEPGISAYKTALGIYLGILIPWYNIKIVHDF